MIVSRFTVSGSVDPEEFAKTVGSALDEEMQSPPTRSGHVSGYRLLSGSTVGSENRYQLEIDGMMSLPDGVRASLEAAGAGKVVTESYMEVLNSDSGS
jgi:hypothetical protein